MNAIKNFVTTGQNRGYEKGETQKFIFLKRSDLEFSNFFFSVLDGKLKNEKSEIFLLTNFFTPMKKANGSSTKIFLSGSSKKLGVARFEVSFTL